MIRYNAVYKNEIQCLINIHSHIVPNYKYLKINGCIIVAQLWNITYRTIFLKIYKQLKINNYESFIFNHHCIDVLFC